jgi:hypothetical protein
MFLRKIFRISKLFFSETTELLESNLAWNAHPVVAL